MWTKSRSIILSVILVRILLALLAVFCFFLPSFAKWYDSVSGKEPIFVFLLICMYAVVLIAAVAVWSLDRMLMRIRRDQVFVAENVRSLRIISWCCFGVAGVFFILMFVRPMALPVVFLAGLFGMILRVVKNVFDKAVDLRTENDFTI